MGAISSEIVHLLKVKLSLQMTRDGFSCFLGFQNFSGGGGGGGGGESPRNPPLPFWIRQYVGYFSIRHYSTQKTLVKK